MPNYLGSNRETTAPRFRRTEPYPGITNEEALAWWKNLKEGVSHDADVGVRLKDGRNLYYCNDEAEMVPAVKEGADLSDPNVIRGLMRMSMDGRLFTRNFGTLSPRQVVTGEMSPFDVGCAERQSRMLNAVEHKAPFFLKILAYPFSKAIRKEFQDYWNSGVWIDRVGKGAYLTRALDDDYNRDQASADYFKREAEQNEELLDRQFEKDYHETSPMEIEGYFLDKQEVPKRGVKGLMDSLGEPDMTVETFYDNLTDELLSYVASGITKKSTELFMDNKMDEWENFLKDQQDVFRSIEKGLKDYLLQDEDMQANLQLAINDLADKETLNELQGQVRNLMVSGVNDYIKSVEAQNTAIREQQMQSQPQANQMQQSMQAQQQIQQQPQPQPEPAPVVPPPL